jgi:two-component system chemotaxis response regulator CheY
MELKNSIRLSSFIRYIEIIDLMYVTQELRRCCIMLKFQGLRAIVTDDSKFMRITLAAMLVELGVSVLGEAENGSISATLYRATKPDFVTMDITMPDYDGLEGLKLIRDYNKSANVIMVSAMGQQSFVIQAFKLGAIDFIVKPFQIERVEEAILKLKF